MNRQVLVHDPSVLLDVIGECIRAIDARGPVVIAREWINFTDESAAAASSEVPNGDG